MKNIVLHMSYDGTDYHGFQRQENANTIQETVETAISKITGETVAITGCSRTDAGVHAKAYVCNFKTESSIPSEKFVFALNTALPEDIRCFDSFETNMDFHARFSAKSKIYSYKIYNSRHNNALFSRYAYHYPVKLNTDEMKRAAEMFVGVHDFAAFMASGGQQKTTVKEVYGLGVEVDGDMIEIKIHANGYLYNMVRIISGTLLYVGNGKINKETIPEIFESKDRTKAGITVPPNGLCLERVFY